MKHQRLIYWSITAALAGFLFGFDTIVISGAEQKIQDIWKFNHYWTTMTLRITGDVVLVMKNNPKGR